MNRCEARISPYDHGFIWSLEFFETFRIIMVILSYWMNHYDRLIDALDTFFLQIKWSMTKDEVKCLF